MAHLIERCGFLATSLAPHIAIVRQALLVVGSVHMHSAQAVANSIR